MLKYVKMVYFLSKSIFYPVLGHVGWRLLREKHESEGPAEWSSRGRLSSRRPVATPALARPVRRG